MGATAKVLNFEGVSEGGEFRPRRRPEGDYYAHITKVEDHESKAGNDSWVFTVKIDGDSRSAYAYYVGTDEKQLWKVRSIFVAAGMAVPSKRVKADPNKLVGKAVAVALEDDEYEGRVKSTIAAMFPLDDLDDAMNEPGSGTTTKSKGRPATDDDDDVEDDEPAPAKKAPAKRAAKKAPEPEPEDDDEDAEEEDEEPPAKPSKKAAPTRRKAAPEPEPEDDEDEDEDEEEEPPARPVKKAAPAKAAPTRRKTPPPADDDDDELDLDEL
jgi:hypothetical protein